MRNYIPILALGLALVACQNEDAPPRVVTPTAPSYSEAEEIVIANCYLVRDAAEAWAKESGGFYPGHSREDSPAGNNLIDFLPGGEPLLNPTTNLRSEPGYGITEYSGQVAYVGASPGPTSEITAYYIEGAGDDNEVILILTNFQ